MVFRLVEAIFETKQVRGFIEEFDKRRKADGWRFWAWEGGVLVFALALTAFYSHGLCENESDTMFEAAPRAEAIASVEAAEAQESICARDPFKDECK